MEKILSILALILATAFSTKAQKSEIFVKDDAAIRGYDAVAYFTAGKPVKGVKEFSVSYKGAAWYFSSKQNADLFKENPEKYAPQYGGYCAYGMSDNHKAPTEPDAWTIVNGRLYLNYNKNVQTGWNKKQQEYIVTADKNWQVIKNKE